MKLNIAVLPGDGIGPEIVEQGIKAVCEKYGHELSYKHALVGAVAIDETGNPYPDETHELCMQSDAVYFGAIGSPKYDNNPSAKVRPEQGLLGMRKKLGLFANIRPVTTFPSLLHKSPLRAELIEGADFMCIRELTVCISVVRRVEAKMGTRLTIPVFIPVKRSNVSFAWLTSMHRNAARK